MYCSNCNKTFPEGTAFCDNCGSRLEAEAASPNPAPTVNPTPAPTPNPNPNPNPNPYQNPTYQTSYNAQSFTPPPYPLSQQTISNNQMTTGRWIGIFLINIIPFIGPLIYLILLFKWAFGTCRYPSLKSFAKAMLILILIGIILAIVISITMGSIISDLMENFGGGGFSEMFELY